MTGDDVETKQNDETRGFTNLLVLLMVGILLVLVGAVILIVATVFISGGSVSFGTVIFIGPFPIVIGVGPQATVMIFAAIILAALSIAMFLLMRRESRKMEG